MHWSIIRLMALDYKKIGNKIKHLRTSKKPKVSREKFAELIGVSSTTVYRWETANDKPTLDNLEKMADYFSISFDEILCREKTKSEVITELSSVISEQKEKLKAQELSANEQRIIDEYRRCQPLQRMAIETMAGFGLDKNPDAEILDLMKQVNSKAGSKKTS